MALDASDPNRASPQDDRTAAKADKAARKAAARRERAERREAAKEARRRIREKRARAKQAAAEEGERERSRAEEARRRAEEADRLAEEKAAADQAEREKVRRRQFEAAKERALRREQSKAAARAALAGPHRAVAAPDAREQSDPDESAVLEAVGAEVVDAPATDESPVGDEPSTEEASDSGRGVDDVTTEDTERTVVVDALVGTEETAVLPAAAIVTGVGSGAPGPDESVVDEAAPDEPAPDDRWARAQARRHARIEAAAAKQAARDDRAADAAQHRDQTPASPSVPGESGSGLVRALGLLGVGIGVVGLLASVTLALAALLVAFGLDLDAGVLHVVASVADPLTAPLRGVMTFSGENAAAKESFVAYGAGSVLYLLVGVVAPSVLNRRSKD